MSLTVHLVKVEHPNGIDGWEYFAGWASNGKALLTPAWRAAKHYRSQRGARCVATRLGTYMGCDAWTERRSGDNKR